MEAARWCAHVFLAVKGARVKPFFFSFFMRDVPVKVAQRVHVCISCHERCAGNGGIVCSCVSGHERSVEGRQCVCSCVSGREGRQSLCSCVPGHERSVGEGSVGVHVFLDVREGSQYVHVFLAMREVWGKAVCVCSCASTCRD